MLCIGGNGDIVMLLLMTTAITVAAETCTYLFNCMFCFGIRSVGSGDDTSLVGTVVVVMVRYWWSSVGDVGDVKCCYGGSCY